MTTNDSGKLNRGGESAIHRIIQIPQEQRTAQQTRYLEASLTALAHQPKRWDSYQDWGPEGAEHYLAKAGIILERVRNPKPERRSWYDGCDCSEPHFTYAE